MADNYLITGYWGEPHVTPEQDRGINAAIFGTGRFVLPVGEQFRAEYIGNNTIRMYDGKLLDNGAAGGIPAGKYIDLLIPEAGQGKNRNDLIIFEYSQDASTLIETGVFKVLSGAETEGAAVDPVLTQEDLLTDEATFDQMALWRVSVSAAAISDPVKLFSIAKNTRNSGGVVVEAASVDGENYIASVECLDALSNGFGLTIIPNMDSTSETITLDVNGLGAKKIRIPISTNTALTTYPEAGFLSAGNPVKLMYDATYLHTGAWKVVGTQKTALDDIYGDAIEKIWENAAPSSAFAAQTITLDVDITKFSVVFVEFKTATHSESRYSACTTITRGVITKCSAYSFATMSGGGAAVTERTALIDPDGNSIEFTICSAGASTKNEQLIPVRVYGMKGGAL